MCWPRLHAPLGHSQLASQVRRVTALPLQAADGRVFYILSSASQSFERVVTALLGTCTCKQVQFKTQSCFLAQVPAFPRATYA